MISSTLLVKETVLWYIYIYIYIYIYEYMYMCMCVCQYIYLRKSFAVRVDFN